MNLLWDVLIIVLTRLFPDIAIAPAEWLKRQRSRNWPVVQGRIHKSRATSDERFWIAELTYSYAANGEYYSGEDKQRFATKRRAEEYAERFPKDAVIFARYNPQNPEVSVMLRDEQVGLGAYAAR
jgi:hypothetical protein